MPQWDRIRIEDVQKKQNHFLLSFVLLSMVVTSLFLAVPEPREPMIPTRSMTVEETQGFLSVWDHLGDTLPSQSLTLQNWMNRIDKGQVRLSLSESPHSQLSFEKNQIIVSSRFFQEDSLTQQEILSQALGMKFDYSKAAEIAYSRD